MRSALAVSLLIIAFSPPFTILQAQQPVATGIVRGHAELADTGGPAVGAGISLLPTTTTKPIRPETEYVVRDEPHFYSTVDAAGSFVIDHVLPGDYTVFTYKPGYISQDASAFAGLSSPPPIQKVHVSAGSSETVSVRLERGGSIEGTIRFISDQGAPQTAASVAVDLEIQTSSGRFKRFGGAAHTDANGHYLMEGLPTGRYIVFAGFSGNLVPPIRGIRGGEGMSMFAPGTVRASNAQVVEVSRLETSAPVNIEISTSDLHTVSGKVSDSAGAPVTEGLARLYPTGESELSRATKLDKNGEFSFENVPNEHYTVALEFHGESEFLGFTDDKTGIRMRLQRAPFLPIRADVLVSGQDPAPLILTVKKSPGNQ